MKLEIEINGQGWQQCSAPVGHRGAFIVLKKFRSGWVAVVECLDRQVAIGQYQGEHKGMRCEDVMEQDDGEEDIQALQEYAVGGCAQGEVSVPCTDPMCSDVGSAFVTVDAAGTPWTEGCHNG